MEAVLYAEVYFVCIIVLGIISVFAFRYSNGSNSDRWFNLLLVMFLLNFFSNFFFKLVNGNVISAAENQTMSYLLKTAYHITLCAGVFAWCGYADTERGSGIFQKRKSLRYLVIALPFPLRSSCSTCRTTSSSRSTPREATSVMCFSRPKWAICSLPREFSPSGS